MPLFGRPNRNPPPPPAAKEPETPPVAALTKDDLTAAVAQATAATRAELEAKIAELRGALDESRRAPAPAVPSGPAAPVRPVISDEDIENAIAAGQGASKKIREMVDGQVANLEASVQRRLDELTTTGMASIANVTREVVLKQLPNYKKFQKEIDAKLATLPATAQANAEVLKLIHDSVVGAHVADLEREAHEAALRKAGEDDDAGGGASVTPRKTSNAPGGGGRGNSKAVPTMEEFAGVDAMDILRDKDKRSGVRDQDSYAQSLGYENWAHYMTEFENTKAEAEKLGITLR